MARPLTRGVHSSATSLSLTGTLTLDGQGVPNSVWVFQAGSTLTTDVTVHGRVLSRNGAVILDVAPMSRITGGG